MKKIIASSALALCSGIAAAHVVLETPAAPAGSYYRAALRATHGCEGSPITQIVVRVPLGVQGAKPMPKAGWRIEIDRAKLEKPYTSHGRTVTEDVSEIRWIAKTADDYLPNDFYDEFVMFAKLPETAGRLYWSVSQICENGRIDWSDIPEAGRKSPTPAAVLDVLPSAEHAEHKH